MKQYLSEKIFNTLNSRSTDYGFTLLDAISSGLANPDSNIGVYAGDAQSYQIFSPLLDLIIQDYHGISSKESHFSDLAEVSIANLDPEGTFILSTRIRVARNIQDFPFTCQINLAERKVLERKIVEALAQLPEDLQGDYHPLQTLTKLQKHDGLFFERGDRFQEAAGINTDFPQCRGIFCSHDKEFSVWINEEDHMRIISQEKSADLSSVYRRLRRALTGLSQKLQFAHDPQYGYLSSCPTNIGTAMRAGVHIRLPELNRNRSLLTSITNKHEFQIRGTAGEKTEVEHGVFDISNRRRLGISESEIIKRLHRGLVDIINAERSL